MKKDRSSPTALPVTVAVKIRKMPEPLHALLRLRALEQKTSMEALIVETLQKAVR